MLPSASLLLPASLPSVHRLWPFDGNQCTFRRLRRQAMVTTLVMLEIRIHCHRCRLTMPWSLPLDFPMRCESVLLTDRVHPVTHHTMASHPASMRIAARVLSRASCTIPRQQVARLHIARPTRWLPSLRIAQTYSLAPRRQRRWISDEQELKPTNNYDFEKVKSLLSLPEDM